MSVMKKFMDLMKREVDLNRDISGGLDLPAIQRNVPRRFRADRDDVMQGLLELQKEGYLEMPKRRRR